MGAGVVARRWSRAWWSRTTSNPAARAGAVPTRCGPCRRTCHAGSSQGGCGSLHRRVAPAPSGYVTVRSVRPTHTTSSSWVQPGDACQTVRHDAGCVKDHHGVPARTHDRSHERGRRRGRGPTIARCWSGPVRASPGHEPRLHRYEGALYDIRTVGLAYFAVSADEQTLKVGDCVREGFTNGVHQRRADSRASRPCARRRVRAR